MGFRLKLIFSYALVILVTLLMAVVLFAVIAGRGQEDARNRAIQRLRTSTDEISRFVVTIDRPVRDTSDYQQLILQPYSRLLGVRILMVDSRGRVRADTDIDPQVTMLNQTIPDYKLIARDGQAYQDKIKLNSVPYIYYARVGPRIENPIAQDGTARKVAFTIEQPANQSMVETDLWLAVREDSIDAGWNDFLRGILLAVVVALAVSIGLALLIARSIARPLVRITRASTAIAQGNYNEQLPVMGKDEIGRLASSFNQMAREVARSQQTMRDFVANVSHELKTPLTSIQGFSQAIIEGVAEDPEAVEHSSAVIYSEAARMRRLVDELLDLSRIESGQIALNRRELDLNQLLTRIILRLGPLAAEKDLTIQHTLTGKQGPLVMGDSDRLEQVFTNILDNAIKYSQEEGNIWLELQVRPLATPGNDPTDNNRNPRVPRPEYAQVAIGNIGPLIPTEQLPRIFERFYKLDPSRKRKGESTGLGLAITKELVEAHQGTLRVTSQSLPNGAPGQGFTVFTITLPVVLSGPTTNPTQPNLLRR